MPAFTGDNLVFILGAPRSGTTWLLRLMSSHDDVVTANVDNLAIRVNDIMTLESNIFTPNRNLSDAEIAERFADLSNDNPGKTIVEKTPVHLLHADRIRALFPAARLVLILRDGRDVVTSLVHVGRDENRWWRGAPDTVIRGARKWSPYGEAALNLMNQAQPIVLHYESLLADTPGQLAVLLGRLHLSTAAIPHMIAEAAGGKGIPIPGVFREGGTGGWRSYFTPAEVADFEKHGGDLNRRLGYGE